MIASDVPTRASDIPSRNGFDGMRDSPSDLREHVTSTVATLS
jgi:hypothetical protein